MVTDIKDAGDGRILRHSWGYDALNRKGDITVNSPELPGAPLQYDFKGNVTVRPPLDGAAAFNITRISTCRLIREGGAGMISGRDRVSANARANARQ